MTSRRTAAALLSAAALALPLAAVSATPAAAATRCTIDNYSPRTIVIGLSPVTAKIRPSISGCNLEGWSLSGDSFYTYDDNPEEVFYPPYPNSEAGKAQDVVAEAYNEDFDITNRIFNDSFRIKRNTTWDKVNASPEPVRKGSKITIKARLRVADWTNDEYDGFTNRTIDLQSRSASGGAYTRVKSVTSGSGGYVTTSVTASSDRCFRFYYGGNSYAGGGASTGDCVDVR